MLTVAIIINGHPIMARSCVNTGTKDIGGATVYRCDDGTLIHHDPERGAVVLAKKLLDTIKEGA